MPRVALWVRGVRAADRVIERAVRLRDVLRDEILFAYVPPLHRPSLIERAYAEEPAKYAPGAPIFESGLFDWEEAALATMQVGSGSRVLVGGVGGGREIAPLAARGCRVVAFEPASTLAAAAARVAAGYPAARVYTGGYEDFVRAVRDGTGPLRDARGPFDAIILGWGSFNHVTDRDAQLAVLRAFRASSPSAPVLVSVALRGSGDDIGAAPGARRAVRAVLGRLGGRPVDAGLRYEPRCAFVYRFTRDELAGLAEDAGYDVARIEFTPYQHGSRRPAYAVLRPRRQ